MILTMKKLLSGLVILTSMSLPALAAGEIQAGGTQPYTCTVVGDNAIVLTSAGANSLAGSGSGSIDQNSDTTYTLGNVTVTGPDANRTASVGATGPSGLNLSTFSGGSAATQNITGAVTGATTYNVEVSSTGGILEPGSYSVSADFSCAASGT